MGEVGLVTSRLGAAEIPYCLVGGLAAIAYGRPRLTLHADMVVSLHPRNLPQLAESFPPEDFYLPPPEVLPAEMERPSRGHFNILHQHSALRADCYLAGSSELAHWDLEHRRRLSSPFGDCWFSPPEAVVIHKLMFFREGGSEKHLLDIKAIFISGTPCEPSILQRWISKLGLQNEWAQCQ
jgi:hypothetical protein